MNIPKLTVIIPCYNEELCIQKTVEQIFVVFDDLIKKNKIKRDSYVYLVDDGSTDKTWKIIEHMHHDNKLVKGQRFIKNFGNQKAILAGLEAGKRVGCDCVISIDADLQQDEWAIEKFIDKYMEGYDIVSGIRNNRNTDGFFKKTSAILFYQIMNLLGAKIPMNHSDYRLVSQRALQIMELYPERALFLRGFFNDVGLKNAFVNFDVKPRMAGESKFNFMNLMALALNGITSFSVVPLRFVTVLGFSMAFFGFLVGLETVYEKIFLNNSPNGWSTLIIMMCVFGGIQLFCVGIIGEYVGQVFREVKGRPRYIFDVELK